MAVFNFNGIILHSLDNVNNGEVFSLLSIEPEYRQPFAQLIKSSVGIAERTSKHASINYEVKVSGEEYSLVFNWPASRFNCWLIGIYLDYVKRKQRPQGLTPSWADSVLDNFQLLVNSALSVKFNHDKIDKQRIATITISANNASLSSESKRALAANSAEDPAPFSMELITELMHSDKAVVAKKLSPALRDLFFLLKPLNNNVLTLNYLNAAHLQSEGIYPLRAYVYYQEALKNLEIPYTALPVPLLRFMADLEYGFLNRFSPGKPIEQESFRIEGDHFLLAAYQIISKQRKDLKAVAFSFARIIESVLPTYTDPEIVKLAHFILAFTYLWNKRLEDAARMQNVFLSDSMWCKSMETEVRTYLAAAFATDNSAFIKDLLKSQHQLRNQFPILIECWEAEPDKPFDNSRIAEYTEEMNFIYFVKLHYDL